MNSKKTSPNLCLYISAFSLLFSIEISAQVQSDTLEIERDQYGTITYARFKTGEDKNLSDGLSFLKASLKTKANDQFSLKETIHDELGMKHHVYQQYFNAITVENAIYVLHGKNNHITVMNGTYADVIVNTTTPSLTEAAALTAALRFVNAEIYAWQDTEMEAFMKQNRGDANATYFPKGELVISDLGAAANKVWKLTWKFSIKASQPQSGQWVYVDAHTGEITKTIPHSCHANTPGTAQTRYSGTRSITGDSFAGGYRLRENRNGVDILTQSLQQTDEITMAIDLVDNDNNWTATEHNNALKDNAALDAHWAIEVILDYWRTEHNRNSYDKEGGRVLSYVHYQTNWANAFWDKPTKVINLGDGNSTIGPYTTLDIVAHEFAHGVEQHDVNLERNGETGALAEGLADIWAAVIENYIAPEKSHWLIAEETGSTLRSMSNPNAYGQPDTYQGTYWTDPTVGTSFYINMGVFNHWFYLLTEGGSGTNDKGNCYRVRAIGINEAARIVYRAHFVDYLQPTHGFLGARTAMISAAIDLFGAGSNEVISVTNAWYAVGVGSEYPTTNTAAGPSPICTGSPGTFVLTTTGSNITWSVSPANYFASSTGSGTTATLVPVSDARVQATLTFTVSAYCNVLATQVVKTFWVGRPLLAATYSNGDLVRFTNPGDPLYYNSVSNLIEKEVEMVSSGAQGSWQRIAANPTNTDWSASGNVLTFYFFQAGQTATFRYTASNTCGSISQDYSFKSASSSGGGGCNQYSVSPNPSQNVVNIVAPLPNIPAPCPGATAASTELVEQADNNLSIQSIGLFDGDGQLRRFKEFPIDTKSVDFDISDLRKGVYILKISDGTYIETHRIVKE